MKNLIYSPLTLLFIFITSCNLDGVKTTETQSNEGSDIENTISEDNSLTIQETIIDSANAEIVNPLLTDSLENDVNPMVYQNDNGLRIEWTVKNEDSPILLNDVVMVNYKARVAGGEQYDSNEEIGAPVPVKTNIGMMIKGWEFGLLQMHIGDIGRIMIPNALGYGENGYSTVVPPKADLIVEIEIISKIEPTILEEGVKVYKWKKNKNAALPNKKDQLITFDYFAYTKGEDGKMYDNSFKESDPFSFKLENDNVIDGLHQGMQIIGMDENAFIEIPYNLAYGSKGLVDLVKKNTDIVYDVRVIAID